MTTPDAESFPAPRPWYRSRTAETALGVGLCLAIGTMYAVLRYTELPWFVNRTAALILFISILGMVIVSGRVVTRTFGRRRNY
ncbi:hypothetical protein [Haloglomus salinum]|jgi:hypothetical protein|uniref:hypothetical protein n=1 Tax=Haloglomus salinum TaxID=2962673 RepID=UPI0020C9DD08|nr:hypothetical protein [Haloglomus salinum]